MTSTNSNVWDNDVGRSGGGCIGMKILGGSDKLAKFYVSMNKYKSLENVEKYYIPVLSQCKTKLDPCVRAPL